MENIRLHMNFKLVNTKKGLLKLTSKPSFERVTIFNEGLVGVKSKKVKLLLNKPIYTGMTVLDLSKMFMYNFHYNCIRKRHGLAAKLLMTDTDSLFYSFEGIDDLYKSMELDIDLYDTSEYPDGHFLKSDRNRKCVLKMKDEAHGRFY